MVSILFMGLPGGMEFLIILFVIILMFGGRKIPELARGIGQGIREFNSARASVEDEIKQGMRDSEKKELEEQKKGSDIKNAHKRKSSDTNVS